MKLMGLIGGMSWRSTSEYYNLINELVSERQGGFSSAQLVLYSLDFSEVEQAQRDEKWDLALEMLVQAGEALKRAGADFIVLCTNTMHRLADELEQRVGLPLLHIGDATGKAIADSGLHTVGLLGTRFTMEETFYAGRLAERFGIAVLVPNADERAAVDHIIYDELCHGKIKGSARRTCSRVIDRLAKQGAQGIILGCTELPLLVKQGDARVPLFDTTRIHAAAAVAMALAEE